MLTSVTSRRRRPLGGRSGHQRAKGVQEFERRGLAVQISARRCPLRRPEGPTEAGHRGYDAVKSSRREPAPLISSRENSFFSRYQIGFNFSAKWGGFRSPQSVDRQNFLPSRVEVGHPPFGAGVGAAPRSGSGPAGSLDLVEIYKMSHISHA